MKKIILTSATILFIGLSSFAQDCGKCTKKCEKKSDMKECIKEGNCNKKCGMNECSADMKCKKDNAESCAKKCKMDASKKEDNNGKTK